MSVITSLVACPSCRTIRKVQYEELGRSAECPCGTRFVLKEWACSECNQPFRDKKLRKCPRCLWPVEQRNAAESAMPSVNSSTQLSEKDVVCGEDKFQSDDVEEWKEEQSIARRDNQGNEAENEQKSAMQYFIKRNEKVRGPFDELQIKSGVKSGKLKDSHLISNSQNGPWIPLGQALGKSAEPATPEKGGVGDEEIETRLGSASKAPIPAPPSIASRHGGRCFQWRGIQNASDGDFPHQMYPTMQVHRFAIQSYQPEWHAPARSRHSHIVL